MESRDLLSALSVRLHPATTSLASTAVQTRQGADDMVPTAHENAREAFGARFQGPFVTGPGRFKGDALLTYVKGGGTSNQFLHGNVLIQITTPKDPTARVTGTAELIAKNVATTGTILVLTLDGSAPSDTSKPPTHLTWTVNSSSSGLYTNATGQGTLDLIYFPGGHRPQRSFDAGSAGAVFKGKINATGVGNILVFGG
jgi:hypothetical protein